MSTELYNQPELDPSSFLSRKVDSTISWKAGKDLRQRLKQLCPVDFNWNYPNTALEEENNDA
jgi:hypothetical protein